MNKMINYPDSKDLESEFNIAAENIRKITYKPSNDVLLQLYGLFKQATVGNNTTDKPSFLDFKGKAKWDAWSKESGKGKNRAKQEYIKFVNSMLS